LEDRPVALVTGSRTGIGKYLSERLASAGYCVFGCSRQPADFAIDGYTHVCADVTDEAQVKSLLAQIRSATGRLDVVVNNAGVASMNHCLLIPAATVDRILAVNVRGTFLVSRESAKLMRARHFGRIVNLTTVAVPLSLEGESVYVASKAAVEGLTRTMSRELAAFGITVNAIGPGPIDTDLIRNVPQAAIDGLLARLPIKRKCLPDDVWRTLEFYIDPRSDAITGQIIYLGGA
jgi:3-oxoacyl-[acyl-carrier protein] reductase